MRKNGLADVLHIQKCYQFPDGIKYAGLFDVVKDNLKEACLYVQGTRNAVIILSKREEFFTESSLDTLLNSGIHIQNDTRIDYLNWISVCLETCPLSDIVINPGGGFDDLYRSINFYYFREALENNLRDNFRGTEGNT